MKAVIRRAGRAELCEMLGVEPVEPGHHFPPEIKAAVGELPPSDREVIELRFGSGDGFSQSLIQTARWLGVQQKQVPKLEEQALSALRKVFH